MTIDVRKEPHKAARAILYALSVAEQKMFGNILKGSLEERAHRILAEGANADPQAYSVAWSVKELLSKTPVEVSGQGKLKQAFGPSYLR